MKSWKLKRYIVEHFEVEADTKKEALSQEPGQPHRIEIKKETCTKILTPAIIIPIIASPIVALDHFLKANMIPNTIAHIRIDFNSSLLNR